MGGGVTCYNQVKRDHLLPVREEPSEVDRLSVEEKVVKSPIGGLLPVDRIALRTTEVALPGLTCFFRDRSLGGVGNITV